MSGSRARLSELDTRMWWFRALHENLARAIRRFAPAGGRLLDCGCGTGGFLARIRDEFPELAATGVDADGEVCVIARDKAGVPVCVGSANALPFAAGAFDTVVFASVLSQGAVTPEAAAREACRCLRQGGALVVSDAALEWLASPHDAYGNAVRRYTLGTLAALLAGAGLEVVYGTYWTTLLLPLMAVRRKLMKPGPESHDLHLLAGWVERLFGAIMAIERAIMRAGVRLPVGGNLIMVAVKK